MRIGFESKARWYRINPEAYDLKDFLESDWESSQLDGNNRSETANMKIMELDLFVCSVPTD